MSKVLFTSFLSKRPLAVSTSIAFSGVAADGVSTLIASVYIPRQTTLLFGPDGSLALMGGSTTNSVSTLSLVPIDSNTPSVSWVKEGLLGSAELDASATLERGWYDIVLSGSANLTAFARGIHLVANGGN